MKYALAPVVIVGSLFAESRVANKYTNFYYFCDLFFLYTIVSVTHISATPISYNIYSKCNAKNPSYTTLAC